MPLINKFDTPASIRDLPSGSDFYQQWHEFVRGAINAETPGPNGGAFYNPALTDVNIVAEKPISWMGLPRRVLLPGRRDDKPQVYQIADAIRSNRNHPQDEYFEWYVHRKGNKISKVTFTTELHDYYRELWSFNRNEVLKLYRRHVDRRVRVDDLHNNGVYDIFNRWNTDDGIMHYNQGINTLGAAIGLAQDMTMNPPDAANNYEANPRYGSTTTSVDPRVDYDVHMLLRQNLWVSLKNPIGIYIFGWDNSGITLPDGSPAPASWWKIVRGRRGMVIRLEYAVPDKLPFDVGDLKLGGHRIEYGGQLAEHITVGIIGTAGTKNSEEEE